MKIYHEWVKGIMAEDKFGRGTRLSTEGRVLKPNSMVTDGPYADASTTIDRSNILKKPAPSLKRWLRNNPFAER